MRNLRVVFVVVTAIACSSSSPTTNPPDDTPTPECDSNDDCADATFCNGEEACTDGVCVSGQAVTNDQTCDIGGGQSGICRDSVCVATSCGDGVLTSPEDCDNGSANSNASCAECCRTNCTPQRCGDDIVDTNEACDDGDDAVADGCNACQIGEVAIAAQASLFGVGVNSSGVMAVGVHVAGGEPQRRAEVVQANGTRANATIVDDGGLADVAVLDSGAVVIVGADAEGCAGKLGVTVFTTPPLHACINAGAESAPAIAAAGSSIVVTWQVQEGGGTLDIHLQRFNVGASLTAGSEFLVNDVTDGAQTSPRVAMSTSGFVIAWLDGTAVCYRRFDSGGGAFGGQVTASTSAFPKSDVRLALTASGLVLNWAEAVDGGTPHRFLRAFDVNGSDDAPVSAALDVGTSAYVSGITVLTSPSERLVVGVNGTLAYYTNADPPVLQNTVTMSTCAETSLRGTLVQARDNRIIAAWDASGAGYCSGVHFQRFDSDGTAVALGAFD